MTPVTLLEHPHEQCLEAGALHVAHHFFCNINCTKKDCSLAKKIFQKEFPCIAVIAPSNGYILADIAPLINQINFALGSDEKFLFIIKAVDRMGQNVANNLLKTLEEPPQGYHFLLLTTNLANVLLTIQSRGIPAVFSNKWCDPQAMHPLVLFFAQNNLLSPSHFEHIFETQEPVSITHSQELLSQIIAHLETQFITHKNKKYEEVACALTKINHKTNGNSAIKTIWRECYLLFATILYQ